MKRTLLFLAASFLIGATVQAADGVKTNGSSDLITVSHKTMSPVIFVERGVEFLVYPDGSLDFSVTPSSIRLNGQYVREVYNPRSYNVNYGTGENYRRGYVQYNRLGQVTQIGSLNVDYFRDGRVARIGDIPMSYKKGRLDKIGNLKMHYDRSGRIYKQTGDFYQDNYKGHKKERKVEVLQVYGDRSRRS